MCRRATHRGEKCAAICAISVRYVAHGGTFRPFFDERTHERTHENPRNRRTNPGIRRTNPRFCKRTRGTGCRTHGPENLTVAAFLAVRGDPGRGLAGGVEPGMAESVERPWRAVDTAMVICYYSCFRLEHGQCAFVVPFTGTRRYAVSTNRRNGHQRRRRRP
jgi:hypothetical protein